MKITKEIIDYVFEEAQRKYDREIPGWVEFKLLGADILRWARLEILSRSVQRSMPSEALPSSPATAQKDSSPLGHASYPAGPPEADSNAPQDSGQLPTWLEQSQSSGPGQRASAIHDSVNPC